MTPLRSLGLVTVLLLAASLAAAMTASPSQAQGEQVTCPDGTTLAADGKTCLSDAVDDNVTTTTSCTQGVLSDDGQYCIVPRLDAAPAAGQPATTDAPVPTFTG